MNIKKRGAALFLALALFCSLNACTINDVGKYRVAEKLSEQSFCVAFRSGDKVGLAVNAALEVLSANGKAKELSVKWFGEDGVILQGDGEALDEILPELEPRTLLVGYDSGRLPFSGRSKTGLPTGFDVEMAKEACALLGWKTKFIAVDVSKAEVELNSGNVDCVWGGFAYDENLKKIDTSPVYMTNTIVLASLSGSDVRGISSLSGKTLSLSENSYFNAALESREAMKEKPAFIVRLLGGSGACIEALNEGSCDAIITDRAALYHYR
ncbi:MAG: transporter substrate-binding domain-containing protein [Clostridiales bacterium]|jgi:ABC-type amino acid transport substrate-binding protein|nr:transporter substrate-binding domain-containing protein [Clostridiales bacterium]